MENEKFTEYLGQTYVYILVSDSNLQTSEAIPVLVVGTVGTFWKLWELNLLCVYPRYWLGQSEIVVPVQSCKYRKR